MGAPAQRGDGRDGPAPAGGDPQRPSVSRDLDSWLRADGPKTLGGLSELFGEKSFALLFVLLLGVPALPLPTGGATHVFEIVAMLLALQLIVGRRRIWIPRRWRDLELAGPRKERFLTGLMKLIRRLERFSRPRFRFLFHRRASNVVFGLLALAGTIAAFVAPPFTGLDTLPSLGVVLLSLGVLLEDVLLVLAAIVLAAVGVALEIVAGGAALSGIQKLL